MDSCRNPGRKTSGSGQRLATLSVDVDGQTLEVSVIQLATAPSANSLLDNVNRWRRQMQLPPITADQLPHETTTLEPRRGPSHAGESAGQFPSGGMGNAALGHARYPARQRTLRGDNSSRCVARF